MLPSNHATHDSTMESYTTSISWRSLEGRRNQTGAAIALLVILAAALGTWARVPGARVQPGETVFPARILSCRRDPKTPRLPDSSQTACLETSWRVPGHILCVVQAGIRVQSRVGPCRSLASHFLAVILDEQPQQQTAWHFGTVIGNQNLLRLSARPPPPFTPANESFSTKYSAHVHHP